MKKFIVIILSIIMSVTFFVGCGDKNNGGSNITLTYLIYTGGGSLNGSTEVYKKMNEIIKSKLGFTVKFKPYSYLEYGSKIQLAMQSGDNFDLCFVAPWIVPMDYASCVSGKYLTDITDLLTQYAPDLYNSLDSGFWDATRINGKIYAAINEQIFARQSCIVADTEMLNKYNFTTEDFKTPYDVKKLMSAMKKGGEECTISTFAIVDTWEYAISQYLDWEDVGGGIFMPGNILMTDKDGTVFNQYTTKEFEDYCLFMRGLIEEGYYTEDEMIAQRYNSQKQKIRVCGTYKPTVEQSVKTETNNKTDFTALRFGNATITTASVTATMTGVSSTSKHAKEAVQLINLMYKDKELYNLFCFGLEGRDFKWTNNEYVELLSNRKYSPGAAWALGSELNVYLQKGFDNDWVEQTKTLNATTRYSTVYGYTFDPSKVTNEIANCNNVIQKYMNNFDRGLYSDVKAKINDFVQELNIAGAQKIIQEKQKQINLFLANKQG